MSDRLNESNKIFSEDFQTKKELCVTQGAPIEEKTAEISSEVSEEIRKKGDCFADEIARGFISDFEKTEAMVSEGKADKSDRMVHVSTFIVLDGMIYMTYYANTKEPFEHPNNQTARFVYCPVSDTDKKHFSIYSLRAIFFQIRR